MDGDGVQRLLGHDKIAETFGKVRKPDGSGVVIYVIVENGTGEIRATRRSAWKGGRQ